MFLGTKCWYLFIMQWQEVPRKHKLTVFSMSEQRIIPPLTHQRWTKYVLKRCPFLSGQHSPMPSRAEWGWTSAQSTPQTSPCTATSAYQLRHPRWLLGITYACLRSYRTSEVFPPLPVLSNFIFIFRFSRQNVEWCGL